MTADPPGDLRWCAHCDYETRVFDRADNDPLACPNGCTAKEFMDRYDTVARPVVTDSPAPDDSLFSVPDQPMALIDPESDQATLLRAERGEEVDDD